MKNKLNGHVHLKKDEIYALAGKMFLNSSPLEQLDGCQKCVGGVRQCVGQVINPSLLAIDATTHLNARKSA